MASKKQQNVPPASTPFSTTNGAVPNAPDYSGTAPSFTPRGTSRAQDAARQAGRNFNGESRRQDAPQAPPPSATTNRDDARMRAGIDIASIPKGGSVPNITPGSSRGGQVSDDSRRPFRLKG